ncbi:divalent-cation tolerance protein CutA [Shewanella violacea]|nr:divalent-cation tolerance protein CutA [Shewanella violacea]
MQDEFMLVMTTCPTQESATQLANALVEENIAACIQISSPVTSVYRWEGNICQEQEFSLQIKCLSKNYQTLEAKIQELHPYQVPEIITLAITGGLPAYLDWIRET